MQLKSIALFCLTLLSPFGVVAQQAATPSATPSNLQPQAPLAPGVNGGVRPAPSPETAPSGPVVSNGDTERTSHCSEAREPGDTAPDCVVVVKPAPPPSTP